MPAKPYLPVALDLEDERALVIGGDDEAAHKAELLAEAGASVEVIAEQPGPRLRRLAGDGRVRLHERRPSLDDASGSRVVVLAERDEALARALRARGRQQGFWLCAVDQPEHCDWVHMAIARAGPIRVAIGSGGGAPGLLRRLREGIEAGLGPRFARFAERLVRYRDRLADLPAAERRTRLERALEGFELEVRVDYPAWEQDPEAEPP